MMQNHKEYIYGYEAIKNLKKQTNNSEAIDIADKISDMIIFHRRVRKNGDEMMKVWEEDKEK